MEAKIYVLEWCYYRRGEVDCGHSIHTSKEDALWNLESNYQTAVYNVTPEHTHDELDMDEYDGENGYYRVERYAADSWEECKLVEHELEIELDINIKLANV